MASGERQVEIYYDQVIEAAYLHSKPGCFFIGPFARRVSFASQQHRALDLVAALERRKKLVHPGSRRRKTIAVIGAGVAGLTAAAALRGQRCRVHLYERNDMPLKLQMNASHRLIHPTISRWPMGDQALTTEFSFLDWFAAPSDVVIKSLAREWDAHLAPRPGDEDFLFLPGVTVDQLHPVGGAVRLELSASPNAPPGKVAMTAYDYVIVTTGFGEEETPGLPWVSYWSEDEVDKWRGEQRKVFVSGCGDGGLIDALRLVHADFDRGWLCIRVAQAIGERFTSVIRDAEDEALMAAKSLACMNLGVGDDTEANASTRKLGSRYENDDIVEKLTEVYTRLVPRLPVEAAALLDASLEAANVQTGRVTLVSRQPQPFGPYAAPIHKLMVAHARDRGRILYRQGELINDGGRAVIRQIRDHRTETVTDAMGLIIRHGSPANLASLASEAERNSLRIRQFMLADYIDTKLERNLPPPPGYPSRTLDAADYVSARYDMVKELVAALLPGARVTATLRGFIYEPPIIAPRGAEPIRVPMPREVFGLDLREGEMATVEAL
jgi:hypothetical protein